MAKRKKTIVAGQIVKTIIYTCLLYTSWVACSAWRRRSRAITDAAGAMVRALPFLVGPRVSFPSEAFR